MCKKSTSVILLLFIFLTMISGCITIKFDTQVNQANNIEIRFETPISPEKTAGINATITLTPTGTPVTSNSPASTKTPKPTFPPLGGDMPQVERIIRNEKFDDLSSFEFELFGNYTIFDGLLILDDPIVSGDPWADGSSRLLSTFAVKQENGYLLLFRTKPSAEFYITFEIGAFNSPGYRALWIENGRSFSIWSGPNQVISGLLNFQYQPENWHYLLIQLTANGIEGRIWEKDHPEENKIFRANTGENWISNRLKYSVNVAEGTVEIDEFQEIQFNASLILTSTNTPEPTQVSSKDGMIMMYIPEGDFMMGSDNGEYNEKPVHTVYLDDYHIDKYEVTNALYKVCVAAGVCDPPKNIGSPTYGYYQLDNYPVINVDWNMAKTYCQWRGASLPTEAQWEKAARGTDGRTYPWGDGINSTYANYMESAIGATAVGSYTSGISFYGVFDMAGNVWEWVMDWYLDTYYTNSPSSNPMGPDSGDSHVIRGGSWHDPGISLSSTNRDWTRPTDSNDSIGFRCVMSDK